jgi:hypothetical protein
MSERVTLSASRIKTAQSCSWLYWFKYILKAPDKSNDGAKRGTICHNVFELLGDPKNKKDFEKIIQKQDVYASAKVKKLILTEAKNSNVDDIENLDLIKKMTLNGLNYDFFAESMGKIDEAFSEKDFDFDINDGQVSYKTKGFIDKIFIKNNKAIIRDFKSSKEVFKGKDLEDNLQDLMYTLAAKKLFPNIKEIYSEFVFLKFPPEKGVIKMSPVSDEELRGFEYQLSSIQKYLDNFNEKFAQKNFAAKADFPKDNSFSGPLLCGYAKTLGEKKNDGSLKWHCPAKFAFDFYKIKKDGKIVDSCFLQEKKEYEKKYPDHEFFLFKYEGCPAHKKR